MDEAAIIRYISEALGAVDVVTASGDSFFFYRPGPDLPPDHRFPVATLVTGDRYDRASNLDRPGVFRLNVGIKKDTYRGMFGPQPSSPGESGTVDTGHDFAALDRIMPHPIYAPMSWVCVLNPSEATFQAVQPLLAEAWEVAARRYERGAGRA